MILQVNMQEETFPYSEVIEFREIYAITGGFMQVYPPSNWKNAVDYHGFYVMETDDVKLFFNFKENSTPDEAIIIFPRQSTFFINYKQSKIYCIYGTKWKPTHDSQ